MRAGARGYLLKGARHGEVIRAVQAVAGGEAIFGPTIADRLVGFFATDRQPPQPLPELTAREREIIALVAKGHTNTAIAHSLGVTEKTVRNHLSNIFAKLHIADRGQAVIRARDAGLA
jgi:DNA-binding NarL/FixJ family response regulator